MITSESRHHCAVSAALALLMIGDAASAEFGVVLFQRKISTIEGNLDVSPFVVESLGNISRFPDLDGDGIAEIGIVLSAPSAEPDPTTDQFGKGCILFLSPDGTVRQTVLIAVGVNGFNPPVEPEDRFFSTFQAIGDLDGDGLTEIGIGAFEDDDNGPNSGAFWIIFLNPDLTVRHYQKITENQGGFTGDIEEDFRFNLSTSLGDIDGDGIPDLAAYAHDEDGGPLGNYSHWILLMNADGTVRHQQKLSAVSGGFTGHIDPGDGFSGIIALGDIDHDGLTEVFIHADGDDDGGQNVGALWLLSLNPDGTVHDHQKIVPTDAFWPGLPPGFRLFGWVYHVGDVDGNGMRDIIMSHTGDGGGVHPYIATGAIYTILLDHDLSVLGVQKINYEDLTDIESYDRFGSGVIDLGDVDENGTRMLAVKAQGDDNGAPGYSWHSNNIGAIYILLVEGQSGIPDCNENGIYDRDETEPEIIDPDAAFKDNPCIDDTPLLDTGITYSQSTASVDTFITIECGLLHGGLSEWARYRPKWSGLAFVQVSQAPTGTILVVYDDCPDFGGAPIACNETNPNGVTFHAEGGRTYWLAYAKFGSERGPYSTRIVGPPTQTRRGDSNENRQLDACECLEDVDGNGVVNLDDFIAALGAQGPCPELPCAADVDGNGVVDDTDLYLILNALGTCYDFGRAYDVPEGKSVNEDGPSMIQR